MRQSTFFLFGFAALLTACTNAKSHAGGSLEGDSRSSPDDAGGVQEQAGSRASDGGRDAAAPTAGRGSDVKPAADSGTPKDAATASADASTDAGGGDKAEDDAGAEECITRIEYGSAWFHPSNHPDSFDEVPGRVTWDGKCQQDNSGSSFAVLSNGWRPFFMGRNSCVIALDVRGSCAPKGGCNTRITYSSSWIRPSGHSEDFDDVAYAVTTTGQCQPEGDNSYVTLSNGWKPHFTGTDANSCGLSFRYNQCGGLFANPVVDSDCPDPGVLQDKDRYVMACTSGNPELPLRVSNDLAHWMSAGSIFTQASKPSWADKDFWAPELHRVGDKYLAYFSARHVDGDLAVGVATASDALGPYQDSGAPLLRDSQGAIDAHAYRAPNGKQYLVWKVDGNASGQPTPIKLQPLAADGLSLEGSATTLLTNTEAWEGSVIEGPWLIFEAGYYYLFYSGNSYASADYAVGVARSASITGPFVKAPAPILKSNAVWAGPGHGSVVRAPLADGGADASWAFVFHAWQAGHVGQSPPGRQVLVTRIGWADGWPTMLGAPSSLSQPLP